jgi:hypothetical protein
VLVVVEGVRPEGATGMELIWGELHQLFQPGNDLLERWPASVTQTN